MTLWPPENLPMLDEARARFVTDRTCPACGALALGPVHDCAYVHRRCRACGRCFRQVAHSYRAVDPLACPGCSEQDRFACIERLSIGFPRFGAAGCIAGI
jgi:hypothetical protein